MAIFAVVVMAATVDDLAAFVDWQMEYGRNYDSAEEENKRLEIFLDNLRSYEEKNKAEEANGPYTARYGPDKYSDLTKEEWLAVHGSSQPFYKRFGSSPDGQCNFEAKQQGKMSPDEVAAILREKGTSIDWREKGAVTGIKNQDPYGTCSYFSAVATLEGINVMQGNNTLVALSEQELIDCCSSHDGCHGWPGQEFDWYKLKKYGASTMESYPYKGPSSSCKRSSAKQTKATNSGKICVGNGVKGNQDAILAHLVKYGPGVWMIGCYSGMHGYKGGVITTHRGNPGTYPDYSGIDHATTVVGAGDTPDGIPYWIVKNSWGSDFGEKGYYRVERNGSPPELNCPGAQFGEY